MVTFSYYLFLPPSRQFSISSASFIFSIAVLTLHTRLPSPFHNSARDALSLLFSFCVPIFYSLTTRTKANSERGYYRWCPTETEYFGISTNSPAKGAMVNVYTSSFAHTDPYSFVPEQRPLFVRDFDFLALPGVPRIAAAVGSKVIMFSIGVE